MLLASVGDSLRAVALGEHNHGAAVALEEVNVGVHTASRGRAHGAASHAFGRLGRTGVVDGMVLDVLGQLFAAVQTLLEFGVGNVATHNNRAVEAEAGGYGVLFKFLKHFCHGAVEVDAYHFAFASLTEFFGDERSGIIVHLLNPKAVLVDLAENIAVGRTAYAQSHGTASAVARQADNADVVAEVFTAKLCAETNVVGFAQEFLFEFQVAEGAARLIARCGQVVVIVGRGELDGEQVLLGRCAANDDGDVVGRTGSRAERLHLANEEGHECGRVKDGLGFLIEVSLVGRAATLGDAEEFVLHALGGLNVNLCGQVALRVNLVVHREGRILRVAEVLLRVGEVNALGDGLFVAIARPDLLALLAVNDSRTRVLAEGELALGRHFRIAQEGQGHVLVVGRGFGVGQNLGHLLIVRAAQEEGNVAEGLVNHLGEALGFYFENRVAFKLAHTHVVLAEVIVLGGVCSVLEHRGILKLRCLCHSNIIFYGKNLKGNGAAGLLAS